MDKDDYVWPILAKYSGPIQCGFRLSTTSDNFKMPMGDDPFRERIRIHAKDDGLQPEITNPANQVKKVLLSPTINGGIAHKENSPAAYGLWYQVCT
jgi:hypothetical protein